VVIVPYGDHEERLTDVVRNEVGSPVLYHFGLTVRDLERSVAFYRDVVGMRVLPPDTPSVMVAAGADRSVESLPDGTSVLRLRSEAFATLTHNANAELLVAHLGAGPLVLQVIEYVSGGGKPADVLHRNPGTAHLCFFVDDVEAKRGELLASGAAPRMSALVDISPIHRSFYVEDPDGVPVEFLQERDRGLAYGR
jgi:catechol 2,3-dioxygenase-like lactoylglutathione lyase family enzyme